MVAAFLASEENHVITSYSIHYTKLYDNNHQGKLEIAKEMVYAVAECGADAVKFQKRHTPSLLTREGIQAPYSGPNSFGSTYGAHRDALELDIEEMVQLKDLSERLGLTFFASAWDMVSLRQLFDMKSYNFV